MNQPISPFRYPGGKSWLVPTINRELGNLGKVDRFIEPFAGGASVGLAVAEARLANHVLLADIDRNVAAFWKTTLSNRSESLIDKILSFNFTRENVMRVLDERPRSDSALAFQVLIRNRATRGGVLSKTGGLLKMGERGRGIASRWYPTTIANRIRRISLMRETISFVEQDGISLIKESRRLQNSALFVDPPYTMGNKAAGLRLYDHCNVDHKVLIKICAQVTGSLWITYENSAELRDLAKKSGLQVRSVPMRSSHHARHFELLITNH